MSQYAVVLEYLRAHPAKTIAQISVGLGYPVTHTKPVTEAITMLVRDGRVTDAGGGVYSITTGRKDQ